MWQVALFGAMDPIDDIKIMSINISLLLTCFLLLASVPRAQEGNLDVEQISTEGYSIEFEGAAGVTRQQAGSRVMAAGCDIARRRGFPYLGVSYFRMTEPTERVVARPRQTDGRTMPDGRYVEYEVAPATYRSVSRGRATLNVVLMNQGGLHLVRGSKQAIDVASCSVM